MILHGPGIPGPAVDRRGSLSVPSSETSISPQPTTQLTAMETNSALPETSSTIIKQSTTGHTSQRFKIFRRKRKTRDKEGKSKALALPSIKAHKDNSETVVRPADHFLEKSSKYKKKPRSGYEKAESRKDKEKPEILAKESNRICQYHDECSYDMDHFPLGSVHVMEGGHGHDGGGHGYGHNLDYGHGHADYGHHGGGLSHLGTDHGHHDMDYDHHGGGLSHLGTDYGHHDMDYGHHDMDYGHHNGEYGHHGMDYGHHGGGYGDHDMDYGHHQEVYHSEPIHVGEEHHNHVIHHVEPVPVPVPVPVAVPNPANNAASVANKAAENAIKAPAGVAVTATNMNNGGAPSNAQTAPQVVNTGYPVYYLPPAAKPVGKPSVNLVKPPPPANGPNPYEILTSETLKEAAGQQQNNGGGGGASSGGGADTGGGANNGGENNGGGNANNDGNKSDNKNENKNNNSPPQMITGGTKTGNRPVNTQVDHSSHSSRRSDFIDSKDNLTRESREINIVNWPNSRKLSSLILPQKLISNARRARGS